MKKRSLDEQRSLRIALLGATGSIGRQTLSVIAAHPQRFRLQALSVGKQTESLPEIVAQFNPRVVAVADEDAARSLSTESLGCALCCGEEANSQLCERDDVDAMVIALPGMQAIHPLLTAAKNGKRLAVANKECLVCGGEVVRRAIREAGANILPIDSEQSAIFQCLQGLSDETEVRRLILTASGGPFRTRSLEEMKRATVQDTLAHPNWAMGRKITVDSATLINKGLEVIEAHFLFGIPGEKIAVRIHPQSIIHSMIETVDGAVLAQLGEPDMRLPIQYALTHPHRLSCPADAPQWDEWARLDFETPDDERFPGLALAYEAMRRGGSATAVYNAADEVAVEAFLEEKIGLLDIAACVEKTLHRRAATPMQTLDDVLEADRMARRDAADIIAAIAH